MKPFTYFYPSLFAAFFLLTFISVSNYSAAQSFQMHYGTPLDNSFYKVVQDGPFYYVLGADQPSAGSQLHATVTRLDANGQHQWTLSMNTPSRWADAELLPNGDLIVVGYSLPFDATTKSLIGRVTQGGSFLWLKSYDQQGRDFFNRVVAQAGSYYVLAGEIENGGSLDNVALWNFSAAGAVNWKKYYISSSDDEFVRDLEAIPGGGLLMAGNDANGVIYTTDNNGDMTTTAMSINNRVFRDVANNVSGGFYAVATNFTGNQAYLEKLNDELLLMWEVRINELLDINQVWEGFPGDIYVTGTGMFGGQIRTVVIKLTDHPTNGPAVSWVKYLHAGMGQTGGSAWLMPSMQLAFTDARTLTSGFGSLCGNISISDLEMSDACEVSMENVTLLSTAPLPDGPPLYLAEQISPSNAVDIAQSSLLDWEEGVTCADDPCTVQLQVTQFNNCGLVEVCAVSTGPVPYSYQWCDGQNTSCVTAQLACGNHNFCVSVTCSDGTVVTASTVAVVADNVPPTAICIGGLTVALDANCTASISVADIDDNSFDNCQIDSMWLSQSTFTQCDTSLVTLFVADWCGNISTCATQVIAEDNIPPVLTNCPQNLAVAGAINAMGVCEAFVQITSPLVSDNCDPSVALTNDFNNTSDASGIYPSGSTSVVWTAMDTCGNIATCSFGVTVQCDTCVCAPVDISMTTTAGSNFSLSCNETDPSLFPVLPCQSGDVTITGFIGCTAMNGATSCPPQINWMLNGPNGFISSGNATNGSISLTFPASQVSAPGNYTFVSTTLCPGALEACPCYITWVQESCDTCKCGTYSDITYRPEQGAPNIAAVCGDTLIANCDGLIPWTLGGNFLCDGGDCPPTTQMSWMLTAPGGSMSSGPMVADPGFGLTIPPADFNETGCYGLTLKAICGMDTCVCDFIIKVECDTCCTGLENFCERLENKVTISVDEDSCKATLNIGDIGCNSYIEWVQWTSSGPQVAGPFNPGDMPMHTYNGSGVYEICYLAIELDVDGFICQEKIVCDTIELVCGSCKCVEPEGLTLFSEVDGVPVYNYMAFCGDSTPIFLPCQIAPNQNFNFQGMARCMPDSCLESGYNWSVYDLSPFPVGVLAGNGTFGAGGQFNFQIPYAQLTPGVLYEIVLTYFCGDQECTCSVKFILEDCCCVGQAVFCEKLENNVFIGLNEDSCKATLTIGNLGCDTYIEWVQWANNLPKEFGPFNPGDMPMHTYNGSGVYEICYLAIELDSNGMICTEKEICDTIDINCQGCHCGGFSDMFLRSGGAPSQQVFCDSAAVQLACPPPGNSIQFTGSMQCAGPNCPPTTQVTWELVRMPGNIPVANNSTIAYPNFGISILPAWIAVPGSYELRLTGHCGSQMCTCTIKFTVDCPEPCPCDIMQVEKDVAQGFSNINSGIACKACFAPIALNDCDSVSWHIGNHTNPSIGTSVGNNTFCHNFVSSGTYTIIMVVLRKRSDGSLCESSIYARTIQILCTPTGLCAESVFPNPDFSAGAVAGGLNSGGMSAGWMGIWGDPHVETSNGKWRILLESKGDSSDVLSTLEPVCLEKGTGTVSLALDFGIKTMGIKSPISIQFLRGDDFSLDTFWNATSCHLLAEIDLSPLDSGEYLELEIPYDLTAWIAEDNCGRNIGVKVRPIIYMPCCAPLRTSRVYLDKFCIDGTVVAVDELARNGGFRLFPNPTQNSLSLEFTATLPKGGEVRVTDLYGRIMQKELLVPGQASQQLFIGTLPAGMYFVQVTENGVPVWAERVVKQ